MSEIALSILMPSLKNRSHLRMHSQICDQIKELPESIANRVEFLVETDCGELTSGQKRQMLVDRSRGKRICFVDDDDSVSPLYVSRLLSVAESDPESSVITFNLNYENFRRKKGRSQVLFRESWRFGIWNDERRSGKMSANHLCAWKRDIATMVAWDPVLGYGDDQVWYQPIHNLPNLRLTENHIPEELYFYRPSENTANGTIECQLHARNYVGHNGLRCFYLDNEILIETRSSQNKRGILVRDRQNSLKTIPEDSIPYFTVRIR